MKSIITSTDSVFSLTDKAAKGMSTITKGLFSVVTFNLQGVKESIAETTEVAQEAVSEVAETATDVAQTAAEAVPGGPGSGPTTPTAN